MKSKIQIRMFIFTGIVILISFGFGKIVLADDYYKQGTVLSTNLLNGLGDVAIIQSFTCTSTVPVSTAVYVKFSQDGTNWYNHNGYKGWWDSCSDGTISIDLTALEWTTAYFYYKLKLETEIITSTPVVTDVSVNYSDTYTPPGPGTDYYKKGTLLSTNLLDGLGNVAIIQSFDCTASVSASTTVYVKFSQDGTNWYNHNGYKGWWDSCSDGTTNIDLTALEWTTAYFYYRLKFETEVSTSTATVSEVKVNYSDEYTPAVGQYGYYKQGALVSTNLLANRQAMDIDKFGYNISSLDAATTLQVQFSQDGTNWYSSTSTQWAWDNLSLGNYLNKVEALDLSGLGWTQMSSFYYKLKFTTTNNSQTSVLNEIKLYPRPITKINTSLVNKFTNGLVGHWTFNGQDMDWASTTAEALDRSGNSNNGNVVNGASPVIGISGQALEFDGVDDYVEIPNSSSLNSPSVNNEITFAFWYYIYSGSIFDNNHDVIGKGSIANWRVRPNMSNQVQILHSGVFGIGANIAIPIDSWNFIVITGDTSGTHYYLNGTFKGTDTDAFTGNDSDTNNLQIGLTYGGSTKLDEIRIYNYALATSTIQELYQAGARRLKPDAPMVQKQTGGLVGYWTFNGQDMDWASTTAEALDRSGNSNNGNVVNGAKPVIGISGQALEFDGTDDYVDAGDVYDGVKTVSFWINTDQNYSKKVINIDGTDQIELDGDGDVVATSFPAATVYIDGVVASAVSTSTWQFVAITDTTGVNASGMDIGCVSTGYFDGAIDEVRVYDRALSAEEVGELYRAGARAMKIKN